VRLKLDENLGVRTAEFFRSAGHDVTTVPSQNLYSSPDKNLLETCRVEKRCLVKLPASVSSQQAQGDASRKCLVQTIYTVSLDPASKAVSAEHFAGHIRSRIW
jgi:predicted nuclease of predicted toxin-antitoxin system